MPRRLVVFFSGNGSNLQALIDTCKAGFLNCQIVLALTNKSDAYGLMRAKNAKITTQILDSTSYLREDYDRLLVTTVDKYNPDYIVLAGWDRVLSNIFIDHYEDKVINLHPSLPDGIIGLNAITKAWELYHIEGEKMVKSGVMISRSTNVWRGVDKGEVLSTMTVPMVAGESIEKYKERMHKAEHSILVNTIKTLTDIDDKDSDNELSSSSL